MHQAVKIFSLYCILKNTAKWHIVSSSDENVAEHRTQIKIISEILDTTTNEIDEHEGITITHIIRKANISHGRLSTILNTLVSQGLLEQINSKRSCRYKISPSGREFLVAYKTFREFSDDFGLTI